MSCEAPGDKLEAPRLLLLFETIRRALIEEGGLAGLAGDWSIRAETLPGHLGSCWVEHGDWQQLDDSTRQATLCQIQYVDKKHEAIQLSHSLIFSLFLFIANKTCGSSTGT